MKKMIIALLCLLPLAGFAQKGKKAPKGPAIQESINSMMAMNEQRILQLADAFPADKYDWRPAEGVRSVGETFLHLAAANYFFVMNLGFQLPEGVDPRGMEASVKGKENIKDAVQKSFAFANEKILGVDSKNLGAIVKFPFGEMDQQSTLLLLLEHSGEHKGQLIAYARMNGITPPWSE